MAHTFWLFNRVASAKAMARLLQEEGSPFKDYEVVIAAGDGSLDENTETINAYNRVKEAIRTHDRTITLSVTQLTTGVTIPKWSGVLMLCNMQSAPLYMQAAFRAQNPYEYSDGGKIVRKDNAYVFDYIPPQKTNQIFTPKWVVKKMVDLLEQENPHIFEDPQKTFADLYMKSGMYITEIVRRLYNNVEMCRQIPDNHERIQHILRHQVYGFAPTRIIYLIATRYILGDPLLRPEQSNFRQVDTVPYAKEGRMEELIEKEFGL